MALWALGLATGLAQAMPVSAAMPFTTRNNNCVIMQFLLLSDAAKRFDGVHHSWQSRECGHCSQVCLQMNMLIPRFPGLAGLPGPSSRHTFAIN